MGESEKAAAKKEGKITMRLVIVSEKTGKQFPVMWSDGFYYVTIGIIEVKQKTLEEAAGQSQQGKSNHRRPSSGPVVPRLLTE